MADVQGFTIQSPLLSTNDDAVGFVAKTSAGEQLGSVSRTALLELSPGNNGTLLELFDLNRSRILEAAFRKWSLNPQNVIVLGTTDF